MSERELRELEDAAKTGCMTTQEQKRVVKVLRRMQAEKAEYYILLRDIQLRIGETVGK